MSPFWVSVLLASFAGSLHCAAMCGPFAAAVYGFESGGRASATMTGAYHLGRLVTYLSLGAIAGLVGSALDLAGSAAGIGRVSAFVAGAILVVSGATALTARRGLVELRSRAPRHWGAWLGNVLSWQRRFRPLPRALLLGLSTTLVPCGWLYAFVATAGASGGVSTALLVMGAFWLGTLPALVGAAMGWRGLFVRLGAHARTASALLIIVSGVLVLAMRSGAPLASAASPSGVSAQSSGAAPCPFHEH